MAEHWLARLLLLGKHCASDSSQPDVPGPLGVVMQAAEFLCCPQKYAYLSNGMVCPSLVLAMLPDVLGGVHFI